MLLSPEVKIVEFSDALAPDFARLNYQWIERYFRIEDHDRKLLDAPFESIIRPGGQIFFAIANDKAAGTAAMLRFDEETFELAKMAVAPEFQGCGIANLLMEACIDFARGRLARRIFLETNSKLDAALGLYRKYGFAETALDPDSHYSRVNVRMELAIK